MRIGIGVSVIVLLLLWPRPGHVIDLGDREYLRHDYAAADARYAEAARIDSRDWRPLTRQGMVRLATGHSDAAAQCLQQALDRAPDVVETLLLDARAHTELRDYGNAVDLLRRALRQEPGSIEARLLMARLERQRGNRAQARRWFERIIEINPGHFTAHGELAQMALEDGHLQEAAAEYRRAMGATSHDNAAMCQNLGVVLARMGRTPEAIAAFREAIFWNPRLAPPHLSLGFMLTDRDDSRRQLQQFLELVPSGPDADMARQKLAEP